MLPSWLSYDYENRRFTIEYNSDNAGGYPIEVRAWDNQGASATQEFDVKILSKSASATDNDGTTSVSEISQSAGGEINVYPNPTAGQLCIKFNEKTSDKTVVTITDDEGKVVFRDKLTGDILEVDLSQQSSGVYIVKINVDGKTVVKKIIRR